MNALNLRRVCLALTVLLLWVSTGARADGITAAQYLEPTSRYGHFAAGRPHEYARVTATTASGRRLELQLPDNEVFEDMAPRLVRMAPGEPMELLAIVSRRHDGARLVLIRQNGDRLEVAAETPSIGTPRRWLNPVGVVDLDGDGRAEVAMVSTPHIGGVLRVFRREGRQLVEVDRLVGFSNHVYGSAELALSTPVAMAGGMRLLVPDFARRHLRIVALQGGRLVEQGRCPLPAQVVGTVQVLSAGQVSVVLGSGPHVVRLDDCRAV